VAESKPLVFIVKDRGPFTHELVKKKEGDVIYVRGIYGEEIEAAETSRAVILAGGTGLAVVPSLAKKLTGKGITLDIYYGTSASGTDEESAPMDAVIKSYGNFYPVTDDGVPGRVLSVMQEKLGSVEDTACYMIGPEVFMSRASEVLRMKGMPAERIYLSMERPSLCGIGMCGECICGDILTCQYGTFVTLDFLKKHAPELLETETKA
jgi:dihydroorotate dehydrogenase electron transfer subunit